MGMMKSRICLLMTLFTADNNVGMTSRICVLIILFTTVLVVIIQLHSLIEMLNLDKYISVQKITSSIQRNQVLHLFSGVFCYISKPHLDAPVAPSWAGQVDPAAKSPCRRCDGMDIQGSQGNLEVRRRNHRLQKET